MATAAPIIVNQCHSTSWNDSTKSRILFWRPHEITRFSSIACLNVLWARDNTYRVFPVIYESPVFFMWKAMRFTGVPFRKCTSFTVPIEEKRLAKKIINTENATRTLYYYKMLDIYGRQQTTIVINLSVYIM